MFLAADFPPAISASIFAGGEGTVLFEVLYPLQEIKNEPQVLLSSHELSILDSEDKTVNKYEIVR